MVPENQKNSKNYPKIPTLARKGRKCKKCVGNSGKSWENSGINSQKFHNIPKKFLKISEKS